MLPSVHNKGQTNPARATDSTSIFGGKIPSRDFYGYACSNCKSHPHSVATTLFLFTLIYISETIMAIFPNTSRRSETHWLRKESPLLCISWEIHLLTTSASVQSFIGAFCHERHVGTGCLVRKWYDVLDIVTIRNVLISP
jgi:hypothetical protein